MKLDLSDLSTKALVAINRLKFSLVETPVLAFPQPHKPYIIDNDASTYALGSVPLQQQTTEI